MSNSLTKSRWSLTVFAEIRKREDKCCLENRDRIQRNKESLRALGEQIKTLKEEIQQLQARVVKADLVPTCGPFVPSG